MVPIWKSQKPAEYENAYKNKGADRIIPLPKAHIEWMENVYIPSLGNCAYADEEKRLLGLTKRCNKFNDECAVLK